MKMHWQVYEDAGNRGLLLTGGLLMIGVWAATAVFVRQQVDTSPLHYTIYFGIDLSGPVNRLWVLPAFATISWLSHLLIAQQNNESAWTRSWLIINVLIESMLAAALAALIISVLTS